MTELTYDMIQEAWEQGRKTAQDELGRERLRSQQLTDSLQAMAMEIKYLRKGHGQ